MCNVYLLSRFTIIFEGSAWQTILPRHQNKEMKILNISFPQMEIKPTICRVYTTTGLKKKIVITKQDTAYKI